MRAAVLGLGSAGSRHAVNLLELGHDVCGFDPDPGAGPDPIERAGDEREAIAAADLVIVAGPSASHAAHAVAALEAGRPVLVEKPLATDPAAAGQVLEAARGAGVPSGVAMNLRFHPGVTETKRLLADGELGSVLLATASFGYDLRRWRPGSDYRRSYSARAELGGGVVLDAIHELDYLSWLLGPVARVGAETGRLSELEVDVEDAAVATLRFQAGALATVDLNYFEPVYRRGCTVVGSEAVARWDWPTGSLTVTAADQEPRVIDVGCDVATTYRDELEDFIAAVETGGEPRATIANGAHAVAVADAIKRSAGSGRLIDI